MCLMHTIWKSGNGNMVWLVSNKACLSMVFLSLCWLSLGNLAITLPFLKSRRIQSSQLQWYRGWIKCRTKLLPNRCKYKMGIHTVLRMRRPILAISLFFSVSIMMLMVFIYASMANNTLAYTTSTTNSTTTTTNTSFLDNIEMKKVRVGDIDIAYPFLSITWKSKNKKTIYNDFLEGWWSCYWAYCARKGWI